MQYGVWGAAYRLGEAVDAIRNFEAASGANLTDQQTAAYITCGVAQMGGIFYTAVAVAALLLSLACVPPACACGTIVFGCCLGCARTRGGARANGAGRRCGDQRKRIVARRCLQGWIYPA